MNVSDRDLLLAILAMDAYNQGYEPGIKHGQTQIGTAEFDKDDATSEAQAAGFYAVSYNTPDGTVISYRGTDSLGDIFDIDIALAGANSFAQDQVHFASKFLLKVSENNDANNIVVTGHSLDGELAA